MTVTSCFVYNVIRDLEWIDHLCINPIHRIGLLSIRVISINIDSRKLKWIFQVNILLNNCKTTRNVFVILGWQDSKYFAFSTLTIFSSIATLTFLAYTANNMGPVQIPDPSPLSSLLIKIVWEAFKFKFRF